MAWCPQPRRGWGVSGDSNDSAIGIHSSGTRANEREKRGLAIFVIRLFSVVRARPSKKVMFSVATDNRQNLASKNK